MKKTISLITTLALLLSTLLCFNAYIASAATSGSCGASGSSVNWSYNETTKTLSITGTGQIKDYGIGVSNRVPWYPYKSDITTVIIGEGVTVIGQLDFYNCSALKTVSLPSTITEIRGGTLNYGAFRECTALTSINFPQSLRTIGAMAFRDCSALSDITLNDGLTTISTNAFQGCSSLSAITFPDSLTSLGNYAFQDCINLSRVTYGTGMTETGAFAFYNAGVNTIRFSSVITAVSQYSFFGCKMTEIELPETIVSIGTRAFANCSFMTVATIYNPNCTFNGVIGEDPFNGSSQSLTIKGHSGSTAQTYAESKQYTFVSIDECEHTAAHEVIVQYPTCTEAGITTQVCDACGFVKSQENIAATGHSYVMISEFDESEENGHIFREYQCETCNDILENVVHVSYLEGYYDYTNSASCKYPGLEKYTCNVEGCGKVTTNYASGGNHQVEEYTTVTEPTCTQAGEEQGVCSVCGETVKKVISANGHTNELVEEFDNTEENGHTYKVYICSVCNEQTAEPAHVDWVDGYYTSRVITNPTCTINGSRIDTCTECSQIRTAAIAANGEHDWYVTDSREPSCTAKGQIFYACHNCNLTKNEYTDALGHDYVIQDSSVPPTCTESGFNRYLCSRCGATNTEILNAVGHTPDEDNYTIKTNATCEKSGSARSVCTVCQTEFDVTIDPLGHDYEDTIIFIEDEPGHSLVTQICTRCYSTLASNKVHYEWTDGNFTTEVISQGSCTIPRITRDTCDFCGTTRRNTTPAEGHNYVFSDLDNKGVLSYTCTNCNEVTTRNSTTVLLSWSVNRVNKAPENVALGYQFDVNSDGIINAKDYAIIKYGAGLYEAQQEITIK